nr:MAG TPA: hypothetical protein [Caudoviricetes sp.]
MALLFRKKPFRSLFFALFIASRTPPPIFRYRLSAVTADCRRRRFSSFHALVPRIFPHFTPR